MRRAPIASAGRRTSLVTLDQALSSASNLLVVLVAAHVLAPADFGRFSLILLIYAFALGPTRAMISIPALVHPEDADGRTWAVLGSAVMLALAGGALCLLAGLALLLAGSSMGVPVMFLAAALPFLQVHDVARFISISRAMPGQAIVLDLIWLTLMVAAASAVGFFASFSLLPLLLVWGLSGAAASLWVLTYGLPTAQDLTLGWLKERWNFSWRSLVGDLTASGGALLGASLMILVSSPVAVAAVRASLLLGRPASALQAAVSTSMTTDVARDQPEDRGLRRRQRRALMLTGTVALANLAVLLLLPDEIGARLLGNIWTLIDPLRLPIGLSIIAAALPSGVRAALLGRRQFKASMRADIVGSVLLVCGMVGGAVINDASGAVWGLVIGQLLTATFWWFSFEQHMRSPDKAATVPG
ncbi:MATE family efflux transporter [Nocardioides salsibiostraticola]